MMKEIENLLLDLLIVKAQIDFQNFNLSSRLLPC